MNEAQTRLNKIDPKLRDAGRWSLGQVLGYDGCYDSESVPSMLLEMKGFIDINDIHKSGSENRPLTQCGTASFS